MKITEIVSNPETPLESFSKRKFTLELDGFQVLALAYISGKIGGNGKLRSVFSNCAHPCYPKGDIFDKIKGIEGIDGALNELERVVQLNPAKDSIYVEDNLI